MKNYSPGNSLLVVAMLLPSTFLMYKYPIYYLAIFSLMCIAIILLLRYMEFLPKSKLHLFLIVMLPLSNILLFVLCFSSELRFSMCFDRYSWVYWGGVFCSSLSSVRFPREVGN